MESPSDSKLWTAFAWNYTLALFLVETMGRGVLQGSALCTATGLTTFFSGIGTAELGLDIACVAFASYGIAIGLKGLSCCDMDERCRASLMLNTKGLVFGDILSFFDLLEWDPNWDYFTKWSILRGAPMHRTSKCYRADAEAPLPKGDVDISGSPCEDQVFAVQES
jgi:hypothetical protein